jgi:hypothetical protein
MVTSTTDRPVGASTRRGRHRAATVVGVVLVMLAVSTLRSPVELLTRSTAPRSGAPDTTNVPSPSGGTGPAGSDDVDERDRAVPARPEPDRPPQVAQDALLLREVRGGWRLAPGVEEAAALALLVGHGWSPDAGGGMGGVSTGDRVVVLEAIEQPGPGAAVVTILVSSSRRLAGAWDGVDEGGDGVGPGTSAAPGEGPALVHRLAVPIVIGIDGATLGGTPWQLPAPRHRGPALTGPAVDDPLLVSAARRALDAVGIDGHTLVSLEASTSWPFIARTADGPHPWLRWHVDHFVVTGLPLQQAAVARDPGAPG